MRVFLVIYFALRFFTLSNAAPTSSSPSLSLSSSASAPLVVPSRTPSASPRKSVTITRIPHSQPTRVHSIQAPQIPQPQIPNTPALVTRTRDMTPALPDRTREPARGPPRDPGSFGRPHRHRSSQRPITIAFEVLGGAVGAIILFFITRCLYNYKMAPKRDRIAEVLQRHNLQREMEELERNPLALRRTSLQEPAPPYFPRPPSYQETRMAPSVSPENRAEYVQVATHSPPSSPPPTHASLPSASAPTAAPMPTVPQR